MIKCLIFDLDNTLIDWKDEYIEILISVLKKFNLNYTYETIKSIADSLVTYEKYHDIYNYKLLSEFINKKSNVNLTVEVLKELIKEQGKCYEYASKDTISTLDYLNKKYDLVVLSNWFTETQKLRLKGAGILKYFKYVSGGDERNLKPSKKAFDIVLKDYKKEECIMIGDSIKTDIIGALSVGIKSILKTNKNYKSKKYKTIKELSDLKEML